MIQKLMTTVLLAHAAFATSALADEKMLMIDHGHHHGSTPDSHGSAVTAAYVNLTVTYAAVADTSGTIYTAMGVNLKPVAVSFEVAGKTVNMSFLESSILLRISDPSLAEGSPRTTNTYSVTLANTNVGLTERFSLGLAVVKPLMRDSMNSAAIDWAQLTAAFTLMQEDSHKLVASIAPFVRTNLPYKGVGNPSQQLWMPIKITYSFKHKRLSFSAFAQYIPIKNFTTDTLVHALVFGSSADYRLTDEDSKFDLRIFLDGQIWYQDTTDTFLISNQVDLSSVLTGLRMIF